MIKNRNDISDCFKWSVNDLFSNDEMWQTEFDELSKKINDIKNFNPLTEDNLIDCLKKQDELGLRTERVYVYANLKANEDSSNTFYQGMASKSDTLISEYSSAVSFIEPSILKMDENKIFEVLNSNTDAAVYKHMIKNILRTKEHILPHEQEEIISRFYEVSSAPENIYSMLNNADLVFKDVKASDGKVYNITHGKYISLLESQDRVLRKNAFESYYDSFYKLKNSISSIYAASVKNDVAISKIKKYNSSLEASLFSVNVDKEVYINLIDTVNRYLPLMHRYIKLRKKMLSVDELHMYDLYTPIIKDTNTYMDFENAKKTVLCAIKPLGEDYSYEFEKGLNEGWIDVYENKGKRSGAYAWGAYGTHPFVSLNYDNTINSMFTLAHEMGHAMHSFYTWKNQPYVYGDYTIFVAEVASTVNEALLMEYLLKTTNDEDKKMYLINYFMEQFRGTLFRQTMFAEFEMKTHEMCENAQPLNFDSLCEIYGNLNKKYYGDEIINDKQINWEWARIPHFYNSFYVYQYATGYSAAIALSKKILEDNGAENYIKFLKSGSSDYSINLLKLAGVDMSSPAPVENAMKVFEKLIEQMENYFERMNK